MVGSHGQGIYLLPQAGLGQNLPALNRTGTGPPFPWTADQIRLKIFFPVTSFILNNVHTRLKRHRQHWYFSDHLINHLNINYTKSLLPVFHCDLKASWFGTIHWETFKQNPNNIIEINVFLYFCWHCTGE